MTKEIIDESEYLRVTTPLARFSGYDKVPTNILEYAADRGTRVHMFCELYAMNMLFGPVDDDCASYVQAFIDWFDEYCEQVIFTEKRLYCNEQMIQGMPDLVCKVKGQQYAYGYCLVDIKTSAQYSKTWDLQTAAYKYLCIRNFIDIQERIIVHLHKDGTYHMLEYKDYDSNGSLKPNDDAILDKYEEDLRTYGACLRAYRYFS